MEVGTWSVKHVVAKMIQTVRVDYPVVKTFFRTCALLCVVFASPSFAFAQGKLKKLVFEDCDKALLQMRELTPEEHSEFRAYLVRVLKMQLGVSSELTSELVPVGPLPRSQEGVVGNNMWSLFEPSRELEAKHCALKLLTKEAKVDSTLLPELISALQEGPLDEDWRRVVQNAIWDLVRQLKGEASAPVEARVFSTLISQLQSDEVGYLASNVLIELWQKSLPFLLSALSSPDSRRQQGVQNLLLRLDRDGDRVGPSVLPLLDSGDPLLRAKAIRLLRAWPAFLSQSLGGLVLRLGDPFNEVSEEALRALKELMASDMNKIALRIDENVAPTVLQFLRNGNSEIREAVEPVIMLLVTQHPELAPSISELMKSGEPELRSCGVRLLIASSLKEDFTLPLLIDALSDQSFAVRLAGVRALARADIRPEEKTSVLLKALKRRAAEKESSLPQDFLLAINETILEIPLTASSVRLVPTAIDGLRVERPGGAEDEHPAVLALVHLGSLSTPAVSKALKDSSPTVRKRAIEVLAKIDRGNKLNIKAITFMLRDTDPIVRNAAESVLAQIGRPQLEEIRKALTWKEVESRLAAARLLAIFGDKSPKVVELLQEGFRQAGCSRKSVFIQPLLTADMNLKASLQPALLECLFAPNLSNKDFDEIVATLVVLNPLEKSSLERVTQFLGDKNIASEWRMAFLARARDMGVPEQQEADFLALMLKDPDNLIKDRAASLLAALGPLATSAVPALKELVVDDDTDGALKNRTAFALAKIKSDAFDWEKFYLEELESEHSQWAISSLSAMEPELAVPFFQNALKKISSEKRVLVVSLIARFGAKAISVKPQILQMISKGAPRERYHATLALLSMDPGDHELIPALRRELAGKFADELFTEVLPSNIATVLEEIIRNPSSVVEEETARGLLTKVEQSD